MPSYRVDTVDEQVAAILEGFPITFLWENSGADGSPQLWTERLIARAGLAGLTLEIVHIARHDLSFAWNADHPSPPLTYFREVVDRVNAARSGLAKLRLPTKGEMMDGLQRPLAALPTGRNHLRLVPCMPFTRAHLRIVG